MAHRYGHLIRILGTCTEQAMTNALASMELTGSQGCIIGYINHRTTPPCPKDIEEAFQLSHPTVSGLLARLEKKGFIEFRPDENDRRIKRIYPLEKSHQLHELIHAAIDSNEARLVQDFSPEEKAQFEALLLRAIHNMGETPVNADPRRRNPVNDQKTCPVHPGI